MSLVLYEARDGVATITLNRPEKRNAINEEMCGALRMALEQFSTSTDRVVVLTGAGDDAFCAGADLADPPKAFWRCVPNVGVTVDKPLIVALSGWCIGGGAAIAMMADLAVATETTKFSYPEAKVGLFGGIMAGLVSRIPHKIAMEFLLLGEQLTVSRAYQVGFVNWVVPASQHVKVAHEYASKLAASAPLVLRSMKRFALATMSRAPAELFYPDVGALGDIAASADLTEGISAARERRAPRFVGR